jgi:hypothetical protein
MTRLTRLLTAIVCLCEATCGKGIVMAILSKFLGNAHTSNQKANVLHCRHESVSPMWESVQDMGEIDKISRYRCLDCGVFLPVTASRTSAQPHPIAAPSVTNHAAA